MHELQTLAASGSSCNTFACAQPWRIEYGRAVADNNASSRQLDARVTRARSFRATRTLHVKAAQLLGRG